MYLCSIDEAGSGELLTTARVSSTPVMCIVGVAVEDQKLKDLGWDFLQLKKTFEPSLATKPQLCDVVRHEIKGADLRADMRSTSRRRRRRAFGIIDKTLGLLERHDCRVIGRAWVKEEGVPMNETAVYTSSIGAMCEYFQHFLCSADQTGLFVLDSRTNKQNTANVHSITTQKFKKGGDPVHRLTESPLFGLSDTHVVLQISDLLTSAVVFPPTCTAYCADLTWNTHTVYAYDDLRKATGQRLKDLQYRYLDPQTREWRGGIVVSDPRMARSGKLLFS